ncbi:hypothetical protein F8B43_1917 [Methylorubrum populi]|uniref:Uncharacterized protein n=1 Tax=Methylorubrum populi TaxID=223967 RepID=A0A833J8S6_9HYPH|nr:hypothetical protein F8B43_1917 [Methylorubrum populi]
MQAQDLNGNAGRLSTIRREVEYLSVKATLFFRRVPEIPINANP